MNAYGDLNPAVDALAAEQVRLDEAEKLRALKLQIFERLADKIGADARARCLTDEILAELIADVS